MKKRMLRQVFEALMACAVCIGITSCGNDTAEQSVLASQKPQAPTSPKPPALPKPAPPPSTDEPIAKPAEEPTAKPAATAPQPADDYAELDRLGQVAKQPEADFLTPARAWAGNVFQRKLWICAIAQRAGRAADLVALTRDLRAACTGSKATFGYFCRAALYFKAGSSFDEAREALTQAIPLADTPERKAYVATLWRGLPQPK